MRLSEITTRPRKSKVPKAVKPAGRLYHVTPFGLMTRIKAEGLLPFASKPGNLPDGEHHEHGPSIFLATLLPSSLRDAPHAG